MFEIAKLLWDFFVLRDAKRKGQLTARVWLLAIGFLVVIYGVGLPSALLYIKNPAYKPLFIAAIVLVFCSFVTVMWLGIKWRREATRSAQVANGANVQEP